MMHGFLATLNLTKRWEHKCMQFNSLIPTQFHLHTTNFAVLRSIWRPCLPHMPPTSQRTLQVSLNKLKSNSHPLRFNTICSRNEAAYVLCSGHSLVTEVCPNCSPNGTWTWAWDDVILLGGGSAAVGGRSRISAALRSEAAYRSVARYELHRESHWIPPI